MMKSINQLQQEISEIIIERYPNNREWTEQDYMLSITRQLADLGGAIQKEQGIYPHDAEVYDDANQCAVNLLFNILMLCEKRGIDTEAEIEKGLKEYKEGFKLTANR